MYMHKQGRFNCCVQPTSDRRLLEPSLGQWSHGKAKSLASGHTGKPYHWSVVTRGSHILVNGSRGKGQTNAPYDCTRIQHHMNGPVTELKTVSS